MILYTDGAYSMQRKRGGIGYLILDDENQELQCEVSLPYHNQTSQRAELMAVIEGLAHSPHDGYVELRTDSEYIVNGFTGEYALKKNLDLWEELRAATEQINFNPVHIPRCSDKWATRVDELAKAGKDA